MNALTRRRAQPVLGAVIGTGILHNMLQFHTLLVRNGSNTKLEPGGIAETRVTMENCTPNS